MHFVTTLLKKWLFCELAKVVSEMAELIILIFAQAHSLVMHLGRSPSLCSKRICYLILNNRLHDHLVVLVNGHVCCKSSVVCTDFGR